MKVKDLKEKLEQFDEDKEVFITEECMVRFNALYTLLPTGATLTVKLKSEN